VRIGCSGWSYDSWRGGTFYPKGLASREWLRHYSTRFDTVELNATFYRLPKRTAAERWVAESPDGFSFAVKVSRYLTHVVRLADTAKHLALLLERIDPLIAAGKAGPLLWQLPPTFRRDDDRLASALQELPSAFRHAFEFRHPSWFTDETMELLRRHGVALVIADRPEVHAFQRDDLTADFTYIRFHHGSRGRRGNYSHGELETWARRIRGYARTVEVWAYFNNDWEGFAPANAQALAALLGPSSSPRTTSRSRTKPARASVRASSSGARSTADG
jgi:uncharacterized protein YecE (DUF72 family)